MNRQKGRMHNISTVEPMSQEIRPQSPHIYNPMIQIKYETNNYYPNLPKSPQYTNDQSTTNHIKSPKINNSNFMTDGSMYQNRNQGCTSPQPMEKDRYNFYSENKERYANPGPTLNKINFVNQTSLFIRNKKKSNTFKLREDQE